MGLLIAVVLVTALAPTIVNQSENARAWAAQDSSPNEGDENDLSMLDNTAYAANAASIFAMFPLFWAVVGIAIIAGAVIAASKGF